MKARLSLEVEPQLKETIESLIKRTKSSGITDVVKKAVRLLEVYVQMQEDGGAVQLKLPTGEVERIVIL